MVRGRRLDSDPLPSCAPPREEITIGIMARRTLKMCFCDEQASFLSLCNGALLEINENGKNEPGQRFESVNNKQQAQGLRFVLRLNEKIAQFSPSCVVDSVLHGNGNSNCIMVRV